MRLIHGFSAIILCFILFGLVPMTGAEEAGGSDDALFGEEWNQLSSGMETGSFNLENLLSEEFISGILGFLITLFLSLFGVSLS